jgi:hypothetical protein
MGDMERAFGFLFFFASFMEGSPFCLFLGFAVAGDATLGQDNIVISDKTSHMNTLILFLPVASLYKSTVNLSPQPQITKAPPL